MIDNQANIVAFLKGLRRESGAYADTSDGEPSLGPTLSALKTLAQLGALEISQQTIDFIRSCRHDNAFSAQPGTAMLGAEPSPFATAQALIALKTLGQDDLLREYIPVAVDYMSAAAANQFDHFMLVAAYEECEIPEPVPQKTIAFFEQQLANSLAAKNVLDTAIAGASLIRARQTLANPGAVIDCIIAGQNTPDGGFGDDGFGGSPYSDGSDRRRTFLIIGALLLFAIIFATMSSGDDNGGWNDDDAAAAGGNWNPDALSGGDGNEAPVSSPFDDDTADDDDDNSVGEEVDQQKLSLIHI